MVLKEELNKLVDRVKAFFSKFPEVFIFFAVSVGVVLTVILIFNRNSSLVKEISGYYSEADQKLKDRISASARLDSINLCKSLKTVYTYIGDIKKSKLALATTYQRYLIICYTTGIFFVVLTAVLVFVTSKRGWDNSTRRRKAVILTSAFYGLLLTTFPKLFDQDQNYKTNFTDYTALSKAQVFIFVRLSPFLDKSDNLLTGKDSTSLSNALDTATTVLMQHSNIDISLDEKQLDIKTIDLGK